MRLTYVTGVSGAGKTTVANLLAYNMPAARHVVDVDAEGRPHAAHLDWLRWRAAELLHDATAKATRPAAAVYDLSETHWFVTGIVWPHAVIDSNAWPAAMEAKVQVEFVMLDLPHRVIRERLAEREAGKRKGFKALLRYNRQLASVLRNQVANQRNGHVLAAEHQTPEMLAAWLVDSGPGVDRWPVVL